MSTTTLVDGSGLDPRLCGVRLPYVGGMAGLAGAQAGDSFYFADEFDGSGLSRMDRKTSIATR